MVEVIPLKYGTTFKRVFGQPVVFRQFTQDVLGIPVNIDEVHTEYEYPEAVGHVKTKYDLFAEDQEQRIIIEIQHVKEEDFFARFFYYHLTSIIEQVKRYTAYRFDQTVYTIIVLTSVPRDGSVNFSYAFCDMNPITEFEERVDVYPHRLVFLTPRLINEKTPRNVRMWLELIADSLDNQIDETRYDLPIFQHIIRDIERSSISPEELSEMIDEDAWELAQQRFRREGREEGLQEGRAEGHAEGHAEGRTTRNREIVLAMLTRGIDINLIAEVTGLTQIEIEQIRKEENDG